MDDTISQHFPSKKDARDYGRALRATWTEPMLAAWSQRITTRLRQTDFFSDATTLLCYVGARPGELDTRPVIAEALRGGMRVLVPVTRRGGVMDWSRLDCLEELVETPLGLLEPPTERLRLTNETAGLCIVPGLLFRKDGHRIGFGGGYYDRFLQDHSGASVGLCPQGCFRHHFPEDPHDRAVDWIITEDSVYQAAHATAE